MSTNNHQTKKCTYCNKDFPATLEFWNKQKNGKYGLRSGCKDCLKKIRKEYCSTDEYKKRHNEKMKIWRENNPKKTLEINRRSYHKNADIINSKKRDRYKNDPEYKRKVKEREENYKKSGGRFAQLSKPDQREKARIRAKKRRLDPIKRKKDLQVDKIWREQNKEYLQKLHKETVDKLKPSYIAYSMGISVKDLDPEILKTKRLLIKIKRELKNQNVKIR